MSGFMGNAPILEEMGVRHMGCGAACGGSCTHPEGSTDRQLPICYRQPALQAGAGCKVGTSMLSPTSSHRCSSPSTPAPPTSPSPEADPGGSLCDLQHLNSSRPPPATHLPQGAVVVGADSQQSWGTHKG